MSRLIGYKPIVQLSEIEYLLRPEQEPVMSLDAFDLYVRQSIHTIKIDRKKDVAVNYLLAATSTTKKQDYFNNNSIISSALSNGTNTRIWELGISVKRPINTRPSLACNRQILAPAMGNLSQMGNKSPDTK
jgi:hypothetical protein